MNKSNFFTSSLGLAVVVVVLCFAAALPAQQTIGVSPGSLLIGAPSGGAGQKTTTITNTGDVNLSISAIAIGGVESHPGALTIIAGGDTPLVLAPQETRVVTIQFNDAITAFAVDHAEGATADLVITSDTGGVPGTNTVVTLAGWRADNFVWDGASGDWDTAANWAPVAVPGSEDSATIVSGTVTRAATIDTGSGLVGRTAGVQALTQTGGSLSTTGANDIRVGQAGIGTFDMTGGAVTTGRDLLIGGAAGSDGTMTVTGGSTIDVVRNVVVGNSGVGRLILDGGSTLLTSADSQANVGNNSGSSGTLTIKGGSTFRTIPTAGNARVANSSNSYGEIHVISGTYSHERQGTHVIGRNGIGVLRISGGVYQNIANRDTCFGGDNAGQAGVGYLIMDGGQLNITLGRGLYLEWGPTASTTTEGHATINGGTITMTGDMRVGFNRIGTYTQNEGLANVRDVLMGHNQATAHGTVTLTGGTLNGRNIRVGGAGTGVLVVEGGALNASAEVALGVSADSSGSFSMSGGSITTALLRKGDGALSAWSWTGGAIGARTINLGGPCVNDGGALAPGGMDAISSTTFAAGTNYTQNAGGSIAIELDATTGDRVVMDNSAAVIAGTINLSYIGTSLPSNGTTWDIITTVNGGTLDISGATFVRPAPAADWTIITDVPGVVTVRYEHIPAPQIWHNAGSQITFSPIVLDLGQTFKEVTFTVGNSGELDLTIDSLEANPSSAVAGFAVMSPEAPLVIAPAGSRTVTVRFAGNTIGTYDGTLTITSNDPSTPVIVIDLVGVVSGEAEPAKAENWQWYGVDMRIPDAWENGGSPALKPRFTPRD